MQEAESGMEEAESGLEEAESGVEGRGAGVEGRVVWKYFLIENSEKMAVLGL